jgi:hypothetical protein
LIQEKVTSQDGISRMGIDGKRNSGLEVNSRFNPTGKSAGGLSGVRQRRSIRIGDFVMKLKGTVLLMVITVLLAGCATVGPGPTSKNYKQAVKTLPMAADAIYSMPASWYPNTLLGDVDSFHHTSISGRLFVTPERLVFAVYDEPTNSFLQGYEVVFSNITWMTGKIHGVARIIRFQSNNAVQSFIFGGWSNEEGQELNKDQILEYLLGRVH